MTLLSLEGGIHSKALNCCPFLYNIASLVVFLLVLIPHMLIPHQLRGSRSQHSPLFIEKGGVCKERMIANAGVVSFLHYDISKHFLLGRVFVVVTVYIFC